MKQSLEENISLYADRKTESDYWLAIGNEHIPTTNILYTPEDDGLFMINKEENFTIYKQEFIDRFSPDNVDSNEFWELATNNFPLFSIAGGTQKITTTHEADLATLNFHKLLGSINALADIFVSKDIDKIKILEIGPGYGNIMLLLDIFGVREGYYAIDVCPLFEHPRLFKTDGKTIPETIPTQLDAVYSVNVFQHLSKNQRSSYYQQIFERLVDGGVFIFGMFVVTEENKDWDCWGFRDEDGKYYCHFFRQLTKVDHIDELYNELYNIGFKHIERLVPENLELKLNYLTFKITK